MELVDTEQNWDIVVLDTYFIYPCFALGVILCYFWSKLQVKFD